MSKLFIPFGIALLFIGTFCFGEGIEMKSQDEELLLLVLKYHFKKYADRDGGFVVVQPTTKFNPGINKRLTEMDAKCLIRDFFLKEGYDLKSLIDKLFKRNKHPVRLSLKSSPENGYIINYGFKYSSLKSVHDKKDYSKVYGFHFVSLPAWDHKSNILLVYLESEGGFGGVYAYKYEKDKLELIGYCGLWHS